MGAGHAAAREPERVDREARAALRERRGPFLRRPFFSCVDGVRPHGTGLFFSCQGLDVDQFGIELGDSILHLEDGVLCYMRVLHQYGIRACPPRCWTFRQDPVVFGALVDMDRGCVTFRLNGIDCPCVRFPASAEWREGVRLTLSGLPDPGDDTQRVVVSCATPPAPPSLLAVAANPLTAEEHLARGALYPGYMSAAEMGETGTPMGRY